MNNTERSANQVKNKAENVDVEAEELSPTKESLGRIESIDHQLNDLVGVPKSKVEIEEIQNTKELEYATELDKLEVGLGQPLSEEVRDKIHKNIVNSPTEKAGEKGEQYDRLIIEKIVLENIENPDFKNRVFPLGGENVTEKTFQNGLAKLLGADISLLKADRIRLFKQTLEYYSSPVVTEKPLWHSTSSYTLRKCLEDGLSGGHGKFSGEAGTTNKSGQTQRGLSVSHPNYPSAETFQQLFARLSAKKDELSNYLEIDSEKITGKSLPEVFVTELFNTTSHEEMREILAKKMRVGKDQIDDEMIKNGISEEAQNAFVRDFNNREYAPKIVEIERDILPNISNEKLRQELQFEVNHPFPCMITLESSGKEQHLTSVSRGEKATHIPFEDFYWDTFQGEDIREIRVPESQIKKVKSWLEEKGLNHIEIVPLEIFEIKRIIQASI